MKNNLKHIKNLAIKSGLVKNPNISFLAEGYGNYNYLIKEGTSKFLLRLRKTRIDQFEDSLEREHSFLKYFESKGIAFCPKILYFDKRNNFLIQEFIEGDLISQKNFSDEQIDKFASQLFELFSLNEFRFRLMEPFQIYGIDCFKEAKKNGIPEEVSEWIENRLVITEKHLSGLNLSYDDLGFHWGDIQSDVFINKDGRMIFYDFEHVEIHFFSGLGYIKNNGNFSDSQFNYLLDRYSHHSGKSVEELWKNTIFESSIEGLYGVIWAAMMWSKTRKKKYEELMYKRMNMVEDLHR